MAPWAELKQSAWTKCLGSLCDKWPNLNPGPWPTDIWAGKKFDSIGTMLNHLRRCANDPRKCQELMAKATQSDAQCCQKLLAMLDHIAPDDCAESVASTSFYSEVQDCQDTPLSKARKLETGTSSSSRRRLKVNVSLDDHGFPKMLGEGDAEHEVERSDIFSELDGVDAELLMEAIHAKHLDDVPAPPAPKAKATAKAKGSSKARQQPAEQQLRIVKGTGQAYIQFQDDGKWVLLVCCSANMASTNGKDHKELMQMIYDDISGRVAITKTEAVALRDKMLKE